MLKVKYIAVHISNYSDINQLEKLEAAKAA